MRLTGEPRGRTRAGRFQTVLATARFYADSDEETVVRWYGVPADRPVLPYPSIFANEVWTNDFPLVQGVLYGKYGTQGVQASPSPRWVTDSPPRDIFNPGHVCGTADQWAGNLRSDRPEDRGKPDCCFPNLAWACLCASTPGQTKPAYLCGRAALPRPACVCGTATAPASACLCGSAPLGSSPPWAFACLCGSAPIGLTTACLCGSAPIGLTTACLCGSAPAAPDLGCGCGTAKVPVPSFGCGCGTATVTQGGSGPPTCNTSGQPSTLTLTATGCGGTVDGNYTLTAGLGGFWAFNGTIGTQSLGQWSFSCAFPNWQLASSAFPTLTTYNATTGTNGPPVDVTFGPVNTTAAGGNTTGSIRVH